VQASMLVNSISSLPWLEPPIVEEKTQCATVVFVLADLMVGWCAMVDSGALWRALGGEMGSIGKRRSE